MKGIDKNPETNPVTVTLREVADRAGVSISTASRALSGAGRVAVDTESRVVEAVQHLEYQPWSRARRPARFRQPLGRVGVILRVARYKFSDPYWAPVLDGLDAELSRQGYELAFALALEELEGERGSILSRREHDGLILLGDFAERLDLVEPGRTVIVEGEDQLRWRGELNVDFVTGEKRRGIYALVAHLAALGRTRVGFIGPTPERDERAESFPHALQREGLGFDPNLCVDSPWTIDGAYEAASAFFSAAPRLDALLCASDELALGAMRAARERGLRLPADLAVTGFDDVPFAASLHPALTTVRLPRAAVGAVAAQRMIERISDPKCPVTIQLVPTKLVVRSSCGERSERSVRVSDFSPGNAPGSTDP